LLLVAVVVVGMLVMVVEQVEVVLAAIEAPICQSHLAEVARPK
jgi:hypothetical protein